ncbi:MAG: hypothetical protein WBP93_15335 [Pyrinomonadaceae bacterium]
MDDLEKSGYVPTHKSIKIHVSRELQELIHIVANELQMSESEAVEELLFLVLSLRRIILAGTKSGHYQYEADIAPPVLPNNRKKRKTDLVTLITAIAFALGALLAVVYILLTKR